MKTFAINLHPLIAKFILWANPFTRDVLVMCKGYNDDDANFTELVWADDRNLNFFNSVDYPEFQLWIHFNFRGKTA